MFARILCLLAALVVFVQASGVFVLLHTPNGITFKGNEEIDQSLLKELFSASLGFTTKQNSTWKGMVIPNPLKVPKAVVAIAVEGVDSLGAIKGKKFPLNVDEIEETTWQALSRRVSERVSNSTPVRISLGDGLDALGQSVLGELKPSPIDESSVKELSLKQDEDRKFLDELQLLRAIAKKIPSAISADGKPDVYWLVVSGLRPVLDAHKKHSLVAKEALTLLNEALHDVSKSFMDAYKNRVLIVAFTNNATQVRHRRSVTTDAEKKDTDKETQKQNETEKEKVPESENDTKDSKENSEKESKNNGKDSKESSEKESKNDSKESAETVDKQNKHNTKDSKGNSDKSNNDTTPAAHNTNDSQHPVTPPEPNKMNLAKDYDDDYPVIFNIMLWFGVVFFFSLLAICIFIAEMDPGRDSIIYRMTSNRMKKDN